MAVALVVVDDAELDPEDVTVDNVVEAVIEAVVEAADMEPVTLPLVVGMDPVELDAAVASAVVPDAEAAAEEAMVVESMANWPE